MSNASVLSPRLAALGPRPSRTTHQPLRNRASRLRRHAKRQDEQDENKEKEEISRRLQAIQEEEAREELGTYLVYAGAQGLLGLFLCNLFKVDRAQYLLVHPGDLRLALLMCIPLIVIDALLMLPDWEARVPEPSSPPTLSAKGRKAGTASSEVEDLLAATTAAAAEGGEKDSGQAQTDAPPSTSSSTTPATPQGSSETSSPVMVDVNVARAAADAKATRASAGDSVSKAAADLSAAPERDAASSAAKADTPGTSSTAADTADTGVRKPRVASPASTLEMLQMLGIGEDQRSEERPATPSGQVAAPAQTPPETAPKTPPATTSKPSKAPSDADLQAIQTALKLLQSRLVARQRASESLPRWRRAVSKFQDDNYARKVLTDMNIYQDFFSIVATSLGRSWLRLAVWLVVSGWGADRLMESGVVDNLYLSTGFETPLSLVCQTAAVGLCFSAVVGWHLGLALFLGQAMQDRFRKNASKVRVKAIVLSDKGKGVPKVVNLKDAQKAAGGPNSEASKRIRAMHRKVLSREVRRSQEQFAIRGARAGAMELLSGVLFVSTGSWVAAFMADLLQRAIFCQFQYMEHKPTGMGALSADIMKAMADVSTGSGTIETTLETTGEQRDKAQDQSSQISSSKTHSPGDAHETSAPGTQSDTKPHDKADG